MSASVTAPVNSFSLTDKWSLGALALAGVPAVLVANAIGQVSVQAACTFVLLVLVVAVYVAHPTAGMLALWAFWLAAPLIRRLVGLSEGYASSDPLALAPFLATAVIGAIAWFRHRVDPRVAVIAATAGAGLVLGVPGGLASPLPMTFALLAYGSAIGGLLVGYQEGRTRESSSVVTALTFFVPVVAAYGILQYFLPLLPWDDFWLKSVDFTSIGSGEEGRVRIFATLNSPGTLAATLSLAVLTFLAARRMAPWRTAVLALLGTALALTYVRSAWLSLVPALLLFVALGRTRALARVGAVLLVIIVGIPALAVTNPTATAVVDRANTLETVGSDGSGQARTATLVARLPVALSNPIGVGLGSSGEPARLGATGASAISLDNGYLSLIEQVGPIGALLFLGSIFAAVRVLFRLARQRSPWRSQAVLHLVLVAFLLVEAYFGDVFYGITGALLFTLLGWGLGAQRAAAAA